MPKISELSDIGAADASDDLPVLDASESITKRISLNDLYTQFLASLDIGTDIINSVQFIDQDLAQAASLLLAPPNKRLITVWRLTNPNQLSNTDVSMYPLDDNRFFVILNNDATYSIDFVPGSYSLMFYNGAISSSITIPPGKTLFGVAGSLPDDDLYILNVV